MRLGVAKRRGLALIRRRVAVVRQGAQDRQVGWRPGVAGRQRQPMGWTRGVTPAVAEPVVDHELQPRRNEHVEMWHRHEVAAREQIAAYLPWIGLVEVGRLFAKRVRDRHVAAEARTGHAHPRASELVVTAVGIAPIAWIGTT